MLCEEYLAVSSIGGDVSVMVLGAWCLSALGPLPPKYYHIMLPQGSPEKIEPEIK